MRLVGECTGCGAVYEVVPPESAIVGLCPVCGRPLALLELTDKAATELTGIAPKGSSLIFDSANGTTTLQAPSGERWDVTPTNAIVCGHCGAVIGRDTHDAGCARLEAPPA